MEKVNFSLASAPFSSLFFETLRGKVLPLFFLFLTKVPRASPCLTLVLSLCTPPNLTLEMARLYRDSVGGAFFPLLNRTSVALFFFPFLFASFLLSIDGPICFLVGGRRAG